MRDNGRTRREVVDKDGVGFVEGEEGACEGILCKEIGREKVDVPVVQKTPYEVAATAIEEGALTWAPASAAVRGEVGALWREGREQETAGGRVMGAERRVGERMG